LKRLSFCQFVGDGDWGKGKICISSPLPTFALFVTHTIRWKERITNNLKLWIILMMFTLKQKKWILGGMDLPKKTLKLKLCQKGLQTHKLILKLGFNWNLHFLSWVEILVLGLGAWPIVSLVTNLIPCILIGTNF
jgi:hypothetical protein